MHTKTLRDRIGFQQALNILGLRADVPPPVAAKTVSKCHLCPRLRKGNCDNMTYDGSWLPGLGCEGPLAHRSPWDGKSDAVGHVVDAACSIVNRELSSILDSYNYSDIGMLAMDLGLPVEVMVEACRERGLRLHHEVDEGRNDWYAAAPEWVAEYHRSGGLWGYDD